MEQNTPSATWLKDYKKPDFLINTVDLHFTLDAQATTVKSTLSILRDPGALEPKPLVLQGCRLTLGEIKLNGITLDTNAYTLVNKGINHELVIKSVPDEFILEIETQCNPQGNTTLNGLYQSGDILCTQCEAEGFRHITYFLDRPDVMSLYTTTIVANKELYPVLLSNGNLVECRELDEGKHWVKWHDPFPKPCYLFALVAGNLVEVADNFKTHSGRIVDIKIYVEPGHADKCTQAMASIKQAMAWDEKRFGREYDLDVYMVVAVADFNMGAMENKGLNIFNAKYVLANPQTATDQDYALIEAVIGHEYFHNWSGNRVTCRDWFQLSLKEGLTIFREQEFCADEGSREVERINQVRRLRSEQFPQDEGPMAHAVRTESYIEINNFYTVTVYEKGAEIIRMLQTLLGREVFRRGMDIYFDRHDGHAVTIEDFVRAMEEAGKRDLSQFRRWYSQAGTPSVYVTSDYNPEQNRFTMRIEQICPPTPGQYTKEPFHIPIAVGFLDIDGNPLSLTLEGEKAPRTERVLELTESVQEFHFTSVDSSPVPSLLRGFSAPIKLHYPYVNCDLLLLMHHDSDSFNRWDATQTLTTRLMRNLVNDVLLKNQLQLPNWFIEAFSLNLAVNQDELPYYALLLSLPSSKDVSMEMPVIQVDEIFNVRNFVIKTLATQLHDQWLALYERYQGKPYVFNATAVGERSIKNLALAYLMSMETKEIIKTCFHQFLNADNMTDTLAALSALSHTDSPEKKQALEKFYEKWKEEPLVLDKWFAIQAQSRLPNTLNTVKDLIKHPKFNWKNPNRVRSLVGTFVMANDINFHRIDGEGYEFLGDSIIYLNKTNPQIAARLCEPLTHWQRHTPKRQALMKKQLQRLLSSPELSNDVYEIVSKSLEGAKSS